VREIRKIVRLVGDGSSAAASIFNLQSHAFKLFAIQSAIHIRIAPVWGNQVCKRSLINVRRSSPRMSKMESVTMARRMMISAYSIKLCPLRFDGRRDMGAIPLIRRPFLRRQVETISGDDADDRLQYSIDNRRHQEDLSW